MIRAGLYLLPSKKPHRLGFGLSTNCAAEAESTSACHIEDIRSDAHGWHFVDAEKDLRLITAARSGGSTGVEAVIETGSVQNAQRSIRILILEFSEFFRRNKKTLFFKDSIRNVGSVSVFTKTLRGDS